jgi:16S rRNA (cytosine967-C5)-methyltransferase
VRLPPAVTNSTEEVLREVLRLTGPADGVLSRYFKDHARLGARERGVIAEAVYNLLRNKSVYTNFSESGSGPLMRRMALLGLADSVGTDSIGGLSEQEGIWLQHVMAIDRNTLPLTIRVNTPSWIVDRLIRQHGEVEALHVIDALNTSASLDLRVNMMTANREQVMQDLIVAGLEPTVTPYSTWGLRLLKKPALQNMPLFKEGAIEVQDEGSQLLAQITGAKRGEMVVDFCAGAGGKTLALGAMMRNTGRLYAFDISEKRLAKLKPRLARSQLSNVHPVVIAHENDAKVKRLAGKIDRVLVDAPCSGLGTLRRNPDVKWRQTEQSLAELNVKQISILHSAARLVKPGGRLVYATCSLLDEENDAIAEQFLAAHEDFHLVNMSAIMTEQKIDLHMDAYLKMLPNVHHTDGFFAAVFERKKLEKVVPSKEPAIDTQLDD